MAKPLPQCEIKIYENHRLLFSSRFDGALEIGRQQPNEPPPFGFSGTAPNKRLIVASLEDREVSRRQAKFELIEDGRICITNLSSSTAIGISSGELIDPGALQQVSLPAVLQLGDKVVRLLEHEPEIEGPAHFERLASPTLLPGEYKGALQWIASLASPSMDGFSHENLLEWLQAAMAVFQNPASSNKFLVDVAVSIASLTNLDCAAVMLLEQDRWEIKAFHSPKGTVAKETWQPSLTILNEILKDKTTIRQLPSHLNQAVHSLASVHSLVASPILDQTGVVIGALYGDRRTASTSTSSAISELEARLVDLLACGVATGLARLVQEQAAIAARIRFEQFFTPELARQLEIEPDLLRGRDAEVTLSFCDIRRFSHYSEKLGPQGTFEWINDVMEVLSECVIAHSGVLVDYIGDELIAMWGAPATCSSQADLACQAAIDSVQRLDELNRRWESRLGGPMDFGIGINSGVARVGNTGSPRKFKYGPLGNTVNLASRVQGASKLMGVRLLVTGSTVRKLVGPFPSRRLCRVRVINIEEPVDLYEVADSPSAAWIAHQDMFGAALDALERDDCMTAIHLAGVLVKHLANDGPTLLLLSRAIDRARNRDVPFDPVWKLDRK